MRARQAVLLLEQKREHRSLLAALLNELGFVAIVKTASSPDALDQIRVIAFDLVFVEVARGREAGFDFIRAVRFDSCGAERRLPIVATSADTHRTLIERVRDAGAQGFMARPFSPSVLLAQINRACDDKRAFIEAASYIGPDRRRGHNPLYRGAERRSASEALYVA